MFRITLLVSVLLAPAFVLAQTCQTFFVDSNTPSGNFARAINDVNSLGCPSGGFNTILIDNSPGAFGDTVVANPLPTIQRPARIELFQPGAGVRHVIRSNNATQTSIGYGLRASARVVINDIDIVGGGGRAFWGGILLEGSADNAQVRGVRVENVRNQGIFVQGVSGTEIRRSDHNPVEIYSSGLGLNADSPQWQPAILINNAINTTIYGSYLGVRPNGTNAGNCTYGIEILNSTLVTIGGALSNTNLRNHIGGQRWGGIRARDSSAVSVRGTYIGLASNGTTTVGNGAGSCFGTSPPDLPRAGVVFENVSLGSVGGVAGEGAVIVANQGGVVISGGANITVQRSLIGQRPDGQAAPNSGDAVRVDNGAGAGGTIRIGDSAAQANVIRGTGFGPVHGVHLVSGVGRVDIRRNSIWNHGGQGIQRTGAPNPPTLTTADADTGFVAGSLVAVPDAGEIDFHVDEGGQGRWYLGTLAVAAGANSFSTTLSDPSFVKGRNLTATFTRLGGSPAGTSRFSAPIAIVGDDDVIFRNGFEQP